MLIPMWLAALGVGALIAAVINGLALWWNGERQRQHELLICRLQLEHQRQLDRLNELRSLRDVKLEWARTALTPVTSVAASLDMATLTAREDLIWGAWEPGPALEELQRASAALEAEPEAEEVLAQVNVTIGKLGELADHLTIGGLPPGAVGSVDQMDQHWRGTLDRQFAVRAAADNMITAARRFLKRLETPVQIESSEMPATTKLPYSR